MMSPFLPCEIGVPQGSNLGPLFFSIFVNDLASSLTCSIEQYADDSTLSATDKTAKEIDTKLEVNGQKVCNWMDQNRFKLNAGKTHVMRVGTAQRLRMQESEISVQMDGVKLSESDDKCETLLGIVFQPNLKWDRQISYLCGKLKKRIAGLAHLKFVLPFNLRKVVCEGLFNSVLCYCLPLFGGCKVEEISDLQVLQNKAARIVTPSPQRTARSKMFDSLDWLTVNQLIQYHTLLTVFRVRLSGEPEYMSHSLSKDNRNGKIVIDNTDLTLVRKSFKFRGTCEWNSLPVAVRNIGKISQFKIELKCWI